LKPSYLGKEAHTASPDAGRAGAGFSSYTFSLPSDGASAIATCTALENACCLCAFEDAEMEKGQGEWQLMVQIGCQCPLDKQGAFLKPVRGFGALEVPADWRQQLMVVGGGAWRRRRGGARRQNAEAAAEGGGGGGGGGGRGRKGKGRMRAAQLLVRE
jgi:hypothetical protein